MVVRDCIDILAIDHYPGTWTWDSPPGRDWAPLDALINICNKYGKKGAIMETGFSTWASEDTPWWNTPNYWYTEDDQEIFINTALQIIKDKVSNQNVPRAESKIILACWYELRGGGEYVPWWIPVTLPPYHIAYWVERNFGILRDDWTFKRGYENLQREIEKFSYP